MLVRLGDAADLTGTVCTSGKHPPRSSCVCAPFISSTTRTTQSLSTSVTEPRISAATRHSRNHGNVFGTQRQAFPFVARTRATVTFHRASHRRSASSRRPRARTGMRATRSVNRTRAFLDDCSRAVRKRCRASRSTNDRDTTRVLRVLHWTARCAWRFFFRARSHAKEFGAHAVNHTTTSDVDRVPTPDTTKPGTKSRAWLAAPSRFELPLPP